MSELQFAKTFLAVLDKKPIVLSSDYVSDPKLYPSQVPYTLPKPSKPFPKTTLSSNKATNGFVNVVLKPTRSTLPSLKLQVDTETNTVYTLKQQYLAHVSTVLKTDVSKVKILFRKKPVGDLKTVGEVLAQNGRDATEKEEVEFGVMILGGGVESPVVKQEEKDGGESMDVDTEKDLDGVKGIMKTEEFWMDLRQFLIKRLNDEKEGERMMNNLKRLECGNV